MAGSYSYYQSINETPVVFRGLTKNKDVNSAHIQVGYAINNNTQLKEQALAFIKYTLSDEIQEIGATASGSLSFPVNMSDTIMLSLLPAQERMITIKLSGLTTIL